MQLDCIIVNYTSMYVRVLCFLQSFKYHYPLSAINILIMSHKNALSILEFYIALLAVFVCAIIISLCMKKHILDSSIYDAFFSTKCDSSIHKDRYNIITGAKLIISITFDRTALGQSWGQSSTLCVLFSNFFWYSYPSNAFQYNNASTKWPPPGWSPYPHFRHRKCRCWNFIIKNYLRAGKTAIRTSLACLRDQER